MQGVLGAKTLRKPLVGTFHTFHADPDYLKNVKLQTELFQKITWKLETFLYNECDIVTCPSEVTKKELLENHCKAPVEVVSNGIDLKQFDKEVFGDIRKKYPGKKILLSVSRIAPEKNITHLLSVMEILRKKDKNILLLMIGDGPQFQEIAKIVAHKKLHDCIKLIGKVAHEKIISEGYFKAADIFVSASKTETQGISVLEAQANKLPCVVVNAKALPLLVNERNGAVVAPNSAKDFANAIIKILADKKLALKMGEEAFVSAKRHALPKVLDKWEKIYKSLL
jgi:1,2-diacylglycerol 3-alpha-glucosyltransferase